MEAWCPKVIEQVHHALHVADRQRDEITSVRCSLAYVPGRSGCDELGVGSKPSRSLLRSSKKRDVDAHARIAPEAAGEFQAAGVVAATIALRCRMR